MMFRLTLRSAVQTFMLMFSVFWMFIIWGLWCVNDRNKKVEPCPTTVLPVSVGLHSANELKLSQQALQHKARELHQLETSLRKRYPTDVNEILNMHRDNSVPVIYAITPTYSRLVQKAELTRMAQTFLHVPKFHWIVIEDSEEKTPLVTNFLAASGLKYTHLNIATPKEEKLKPNEPTWHKHRGVLQRNEGLDYLRQALDPDVDVGVVYFADDDNVYDLRVFDEMRYTDKVSVWPVGMVGKLKYESPIVSKGRVTGWHTYQKRPFSSDMAGFAINLHLFLIHLEAEFSMASETGYLETDLLAQLKITMDDLEPKADDCSKILVWHTRTEEPNIKNEKRFRDKGLPGSNPLMEV